MSQASINEAEEVVKATGFTRPNESIDENKLEMLMDEVVEKMTKEVGKPVICRQNRTFFDTPKLGCSSHQRKIKSKTIRAKSSYSETSHYKSMKKRQADMNNAFGKIKEVLIQKGIKTELKLSSQEKILFAVVEYINSEDLHQLFPPLVFNSNETTKEKRRRQKQQSKEKHTLAYSRIEEFIVSSKCILNWNKRPLRHLDVLEASLQLIKNKTPNASVFPMSPTNTNALPNVSESSINPDLSSKPPVARLLKHSVDSMLGGPLQINSDPQPVLSQPMNQLNLQNYASNFTWSNKVVQNQLSIPMENKENENGSGSFVFGTFNKF